MKKQPAIYLAPFQGITGVIYRRVHARHFKGIDKYFTPFFTHVIHHKSPVVKAGELNDTTHNRAAVVPQILSKDAHEILTFALFCKEKGFGEINWNMGCPFARVANKKRGSGLLPYPGMVKNILEDLMPVMPVSFSVKCRLGYYDPAEILDLVPLFNQFGISELVIHARIGKQLYKGGVLDDEFARALKLSTVPVVYNGDIFTVQDFQKAAFRFPGINTWMIGRGILMDPFLPEDIKGIDRTGDRKPIVRKFVDDLYYAYRKRMNDRLQAINVMKELWGYLSQSFDDPLKTFNSVKKTKTFDDYEDAVNRIFKQFEWQGRGVRS